MQNTYVCLVCGTNAVGPTVPDICAICAGQKGRHGAPAQFALAVDLIRDHHVALEEIREQVFRLRAEPSIGGEYDAYVLLHPCGNVLIDCPPILDPALVAPLEEFGGLSRIFVTHADLLGAAHLFRSGFGAEVFLHRGDAGAAVRGTVDHPFTGAFHLEEDLKVISAPGNTPGSSCLLDMRNGGILFSGSVIAVSAQEQIECLQSYRRAIAHHPHAFDQIYETLMGSTFDAIYSPWGRVEVSGKEKLRAYAKRTYFDPRWSGPSGGFSAPPADTATSIGKAAAYLRARESLRGTLHGERNRLARMAVICCLLADHLPYFYWAGFYLLDPENPHELVLGPFRGSAACLRVPVGKGVCGRAAQARESLIIDDVLQERDLIVCDPRSRSEIAVPVTDPSGNLLGVLDVDSTEVGAFDEQDRSHLESIAREFVTEVP
ncbi:MAG: GAF domain-containing protein [Planctomycetota bacterium]